MYQADSKKVYNLGSKHQLCLCMLSAQLTHRAWGVHSTYKSRKYVTPQTQVATKNMMFLQLFAGLLLAARDSSGSDHSCLIENVLSN